VKNTKESNISFITLHDFFYPATMIIKRNFENKNNLYISVEENKEILISKKIQNHMITLLANKS
jgi:hypothetical protein